ncbi:hypothetical protein CcaverHIS002_0400890 [Cutaneotrichosporon cavernicola]|uniref:Uncharacterized protein n=1 Tax=Cutaneotrichosporon cavernicola TaxID=279322 RepID=A0AA48L3G8_9TREE|nr:uncharacterized protein CcaverHIS019_0400850 [Cutaneotrichosporon cavernicola]BEI83485.1 hypothetical protein CcaverHIS002_0400890 [Cutaneotrichosporon cavernicola]BEI91265.1 hypothetical protein CcaverHIS019_0400850 [Cutaneotrichosporon cavernicola]BEI99038.1 hypothetical protein CcaverHIS631_0400810 [Cutaneotrichosporon cavernicola]BEJ06812.1 hypothetical protein CcaverHIS641_0400810 [Cutaneotrichosporon cavernicola]
MPPISVQRFMRRTEALRRAPPPLDHRASEHMPTLIPRPSTPSTPAEIVRGTSRWPGVLVLRPVTVFAPPSFSNVSNVGTPGSEASDILQTPTEASREFELNVKVKAANMPPARFPSPVPFGSNKNDKVPPSSVNNELLNSIN